MTKLIRFVIGLLAVSQGIFACEADNLIWIPREKSADPLYRFVIHDKAGYIDQTGRVIIPPKFQDYGSNSGYEFHDGLLETTVSDGVYADRTGKIVINIGLFRGWDFSEGLAVAMRKDGETWGYIDLRGNFAISPRFAWVRESYPDGYPSSFSDGYAKINHLGMIGYIDRSGRFAITPSFLEGYAFHDGLARVVVEGPCVFLTDGPCLQSYVVPEKSGQRNRVEKLPKCKFAFINKSGTIVSAERYEWAKDFSEGMAAVLVNGKVGYIDRSGAMVIAPQFESAGHSQTASP